MPRHALIAFTAPTPGLEGEFQNWYDNVHTPEILAIDGMVRSRRFRIKMARMNDAERYQYLAIHEVETDDLKSVLKAIGGIGAPPACLDPEASATLIVDEVFSSDAAKDAS